MPNSDLINSELIPSVTGTRSPRRSGSHGSDNEVDL
jgi:hypothetical protein